MHSLTHSIYVGWTTHPGWVTFLYFLGAIFISKNFILTPFHAYGAHLRLGARREMQGNLNLIKFLHGDTNRLVVYLAYNAVDAIVWSGAIAVFYSFLTISIGTAMKNPSILSLNSYSIFIGGIVGRAILMRQILGLLRNYDQSAPALEAALAKPIEPPKH